MKVSCSNCAKEFSKPKCWAKRVKLHFCSVECHDAHQTIRIAKNCIVCSSEFSVRPSEDHKFKTCSKKCLRVNRLRNKNSNWNGGKTRDRKAAMSTVEYKQWRLSVFQRDRFTCVFCGKSKGDLNADHIKPWAFFPDLRYDLSNGRTLCVPCHKTTYKDNLKFKQTNDSSSH